jgi:hypothetical protein
MSIGKFAAALAVGALLAACAATGVQIKEEQLARLEKGKTTVAEAVTILGQPTGNMLMSNGERMLTYTYAEYKTRAATFIPYVGPFVGGSDTRTNSAVLRFSKDGVLRDYSANTHQFGTGLGAASGTGPDQVEQQPRQAP